MAVTAIVYFVRIIYLINLWKNTLQMLTSRKIWRKSVQGFNCYSTLSIYKMTVAAILDSVKCYIRPICRKIRHRCYLPLNMTISSKVLALLLFQRWRTPADAASFSFVVYSYVSLSISYLWTLTQFQISWKFVEWVKSYSDSLKSRFWLWF